MSGNPILEARRSKRHSIIMRLGLLMDPSEAENRNEVFTLNLSRHGCRIKDNTSLTQGQLVSLIPSDPPRVPILARVVWVGGPASDLAGEAGIDFLQSLPSHV